MHDCKRLRDEIWEAVEAEDVSDGLLSRVGECETCRGELAKAQSAMQGFQVFRSVDAPDCSSVVIAKIEGVTGRRRAVWAYALGLVLVLAVVTMVTFTHRPKDKQHDTGNMAKGGAHQSIVPNQVTSNPESLEKQVAAENPNLSKVDKKPAETRRPTHVGRVRRQPRINKIQKSIAYTKWEGLLPPKPTAQAVDPVSPPEQDELTVAIIVMEDTDNPAEQSGEALDYGYTHKSNDRRYHAVLGKKIGRVS